MRVATVSVRTTESGRSAGVVTPSLNFYPSASDAIGTPSIHYGVLRDLYASMLAVDPDGSHATFRFYLNPGVLWLWVGLGVVALGGLLAAWPSGRRTSAAPPSEAGAKAYAEVA